MFSFLEIECEDDLIPLPLFSIEVYLQFLHSVFIVRSIDEEIRTEVFESAMMIDMEERMFNNGIRDSEVFPRLIGDPSIGYLMLAKHIRHHISRRWKDDGSIFFVRDRCKSGIRTIENHGNFWLDNPSFLICDCLECIPEEFHMIIGDARDDREDWHDDIGRIESPSHPYLDDCIFTARVSEIEKRQENTFLIV